MPIGRASTSRLSLTTGKCGTRSGDCGTYVIGTDGSSCAGVRSEAAGSQFLTLLANAIWEVPVYAGEVDQAVVVDGSGLELAWTGTVHVAKPGMTGTSTFQGAIRR